MTPDNIQLFCQFFYKRIWGKIRSALDKPSGIASIGLENGLHQIFKPLLEVSRHGIKVILVPSGACQQVSRSMFQSTKLLLDVFPISKAAIHDLNYTQRVVIENVRAQFMEIVFDIDSRQGGGRFGA